MLRRLTALLSSFLLATTCAAADNSQAASVAAAAPAARPVVNAARIAAADREPGSWLSTGRTYSGQRYSPLEEINSSNVSALGLAWTFKVDVDRAAEATPLVVDGVMYTTGAYSIVYALDAATGALLWRFDPKVPRATAGYSCCDVANRGVAIMQRKIFFGTLDGRLIALDARTGVRMWETNTIDDAKRTYTITGAPLAVGNLVLIGNGGAEFNARGYLSAFDAATGRLVWRFYTIPGDPQAPDENPAMTMARKTWTGQRYWKQGGGGTVWNTIAYDPESQLVFFGTGNGVSWNKAERGESGADNLFISSIVAVRAGTGEYVWHYQETPGDMWDYDAAANLILADLNLRGRSRKVLLHAPKNGFFYVIDRTRGKLLSAQKFVPVNWATAIDLKSGRPRVDAKAADWTLGARIVMPGPFGAHNWQPMSFSPRTGLVYIPAQEAPSLLAPHQDPTFDDRAGVWNLGADLPLPEDSQGVLAAAASYRGRLVAWDPVAQRVRWSQEYSNIWNGGTLATAGNLVFQGTADGLLVAYSADSGRKLWSARANSGVMAGPMSYAINGEQYVAVMAGWGGVFPLVGGAVANLAKVRPEARVLVFKLGGHSSLPPPVHKPMPLPALQAVTADPPTLARGANLFGNNCAFCHGATAVSGGLVPDLRYLTPEQHQIFAAVVAGARAERGMPSFAGRFGNEDVEAIHQYVIKRSHDLAGELSSGRGQNAAAAE